MEPVFLFCVGATKAGTSWLYDQLRGHPECRLRTIKEYHYFSNSTPMKWSNLLAENTEEIQLLTGAELIEDPTFVAERLGDLRQWDAVLRLGQIDLDKFRRFLLDGLAGRRLVGDFTPAYSVISANGLRKLQGLGALRIVYLIRDPLARLWSHIRMLAARNAPDNFAQIAETTLRRALAGKQDGGIQGMLRRGDYKTNLPKLRRVFGRDLLVMFSEELTTAVGFARLLDFLGLSQVQAEFSKFVHEGRALPFPTALRAATLRFLRPQYDYIASEFSDLPQAWRLNMNEALT